MLAPARLGHVTGTRWGTRWSLGMNQLKTLEETPNQRRDLTEFLSIPYGALGGTPSTPNLYPTENPSPKPGVRKILDTPLPSRP